MTVRSLEPVTHLVKLNPFSVFRTFSHIDFSSVLSLEDCVSELVGVIATVKDSSSHDPTCLIHFIPLFRNAFSVFLSA